jgi:hypothetical protein
MQDPTQRQASSSEPSEERPSDPPLEYASQRQIDDVPHYSPSTLEVPKQSSMQDQAIFVYPDRRQIVLAMVCFIVAVFVGLLATIHWLDINSYNTPSVILASIVLIVFSIFTVFIIANTVQLIFTRIPLLIINHEGISVDRRGLFQRRFTPWNQIEAIYIYTSYIQTYFCIRPKDTKRFLRRSHMLERWIRSDNEKYGVAVESITQAALEMSVDEILQRLATYYTYELNTYHIRLYP